MRKYLLVILIPVLLSYTTLAFDDESKDKGSTRFNSLAVDNNAEFNHLRFLIEAKNLDNPDSIIGIKKSIQKSLEYFFIGLTIPNKKFWVNLNPDEPHRIIDSILGSTDLGRIMLMADLRLKENIGELTNPKTSKIGREFWNRLYEKARQLGITGEIPVINRLWIVPDEAVVYENENQFSIVKSKLKVCLESAYLSQNIDIIDRRQRKLQDYASRLMEELILPYLNEKVNEDYSYIDLREVYNALILAKCYKDKFSYRNSFLLKNVNIDITEDTEINLPYSPEDIYKNYLKSLKNGEYSFSETNNSYSTIVIRHYFSGGVDFTNIKITKVDKPIQPQANEDSSYFTCDLLLPRGIDRPLQYAKNQLELSPGNLIQNQDSSIMLAKKLPAIAPIKLADQRILNLDSVGRIDRLVLSKL